MTDVERLLSQIEAQCRIAREALADEAEGRLRDAALLISVDADRLADLVTTW